MYNVYTIVLHCYCMLFMHLYRCYSQLLLFVFNNSPCSVGFQFETYLHFRLILTFPKPDKLNTNNVRCYENTWLLISLCLYQRWDIKVDQSSNTLLKAASVISGHFRAPPVISLNRHLGLLCHVSYFLFPETCFKIKTSLKLQVLGLKLLWDPFILFYYDVLLFLNARTCSE